MQHRFIRIVWAKYFLSFAEILVFFHIFSANSCIFSQNMLFYRGTYALLLGRIEM